MIIIFIHNMVRGEKMTLDKVKKGQRFYIKSLPNEKVRLQALRFGIGEGEVLTCAEVIPAGPIIIVKNYQEIALGRELARLIEVQLLENQ